jgi:voltage-gated potassium channel
MQEKPLYDEYGIRCGPMDWQRKAFIIIFQSDTAGGRQFDVVLLIAILCSVFVVMADSISSVQQNHSRLLNALELGFTLAFTLEYLLRCAIVEKPIHYMRSLLGIIDLLSILPTFLGLIISGPEYFVVIRSLRLLRVFRILKLAHFLIEIQQLSSALLQSMRKIGIFMLSVILLVVILGSIMYVVEGGQNGFESIPMSIYWAVITVTTVGYGDIVPVTYAGKAIATFIMLVGYSIIAIPTGIVSVELGKATRSPSPPNNATPGFQMHSCPRCREEHHLIDAHYCHRCGESLIDQNAS